MLDWDFFKSIEWQQVNPLCFEAVVQRDGFSALLYVEQHANEHWFASVYDFFDADKQLFQQEVKDLEIGKAMCASYVWSCIRTGVKNH